MRTPTREEAPAARPRRAGVSRARVARAVTVRAGVLARRRRDAAAVVVLCVAAALWCLPGLHAPFYGAFDLALRYGLDQGALRGLHNVVNGDTARQDAVWAILNWRAVHAGHLPLWDPYVLTGLPELANLQSAPLSLPSVVSYLVPLRWAYTTVVLVKLLVAGTGCYAAARVLGAGRVPALLGGLTGELAGPLAAWAGWPQAGVAAWTGWILAGELLVLERPTRRRVGALACAIAAAGLSGFPEVLVIQAVAGALLAVVVAARRRPGAASRLAALGAAVTLGAGLCAPAWLPALRVLLASVSVGRLPALLPPRALWRLVDPGYDGSPAPGGWFGPSNYYETAAFLGPAAVALALLALVARRRNRAVVATGVAAAGVLVLALGFPVVARAEQAIPVLKSVAFGRGLLVFGELVAVLAAVGLDSARRSRPLVLGGLVLLAVVPTLLVLAGALEGLAPAVRAARVDGALVGLVPLAALALLAVARAVGAGRLTALSTLLLPAAQAGALIAASAPANTWASVFLPETPALSRAVAAADGGLVALGGEHPAFVAVHLGVIANLNAAFGLRELAGYDGTIPRALERAWAAVAPAPGLAAAEVADDVTSFVPPVTTRRVAAALGVSDVLEPARVSWRLTDDAARRVRRGLRAAGVTAPATAAGVLDDLEWWVEQPALIGAYEPAAPGRLAAYLAATASSALPKPAPLATMAGAAAAALRAAARSPHLLVALRRSLTDAPPRGTVVVARLGEEVLRRFTGLSGVAPAPGAKAVVRAPLRFFGDARAKFSVELARPGVVRVAITDEPGWRASASGRPLALQRAAGGALLAVALPVGTSQVVLSYWPPLLSLGLALCALGLVVLGALVAPGEALRRAPGRRTVPSRR